MTPIKIFRDLLPLIAFSFTFISCAQQNASLEDVSNKIIKPAFLDVESASIDSILSSLSLEEQIAQLLMVPIYALQDRSDWEEAENWVQNIGLGGVICLFYFCK